MGISLGMGSFKESKSCSFKLGFGSYKSAEPVKQYVVVEKEGKQIKFPNPVPSNFKVVEMQTLGNWVIVKVNYPDCKNYEGDKILVFDNYGTYEQCVDDKYMDPHFGGDSTSPVARFEPTKRGWNMAINLIKMMNNL